jgi:anti-sigma factor RsiW
MTGRDLPIGEDDLQALVDGRRMAERSAYVEKVLADNPELVERVDAYRSQREALRERLQFKGDEPIPTRLRVGPIIAHQREYRRGRLKTAAVAASWLLLGVFIGWFADDVAGPEILPPGLTARWGVMAHDAISAHQAYAVETAHPVEVPASDERHLGQWVSKRLGRELRIPDLSSLGFKLVGGRILPAGQSLAAQFMYEDVGAGSRITFYVRVGENGESALRFARQGTVEAFYWVDDGCGYVVSGSVERERLKHAAESALEQLEHASKNG